jgi:uncharacterized membrane protein
MSAIVYSSTGTIHLIAAIISLITGTAVLALKKGTKIHIKMGYLYIASMIIVNITAFMIYRLFGSFGIFHYAALLSLATVIAGSVPAIWRIPQHSWITLHFSFMYWSVWGLYAAFAAEVLTRIPETPFLTMVGYATGGIMFIGGTYFYWKKEEWVNQFEHGSPKESF